MTESPGTVVVLDDEVSMLTALQKRFEVRGWKVRTYPDSESFAAAEFKLSDPIVVIVDHDLGGGVVGYEIVTKLRQARPDGLALPIVYLTGRESEKSYLEQRLRDPNLRPSCFISKNRLAHIDLLDICAALLVHFQQTLEQEQSQALRRAVAQVAMISPETEPF